jgi:hypothetical protein
VNDNGGGWPLFIAVVFTVAIMFSIYTYAGAPYDRCSPDEVWAWQMAYRPDAENREWECVAISDLQEAK